MIKLLFILLFSSSVQAQVKVAVIDTGFNMKYKDKVKLCKTGHKAFVGTSIHDDHGHGTHIAGLIAKNAKVDYCLMIIKYFSPRIKGDNLTNSNKAIRWAIDQGADIINYSGGGIESSLEEYKLVKEALNKNIVFVAAAGNESTKLYEKEGHTYYPAMYDPHIIVVGNLEKTNENLIRRAPSSNYGKPVDIQVFGTNIKSINGYMTGTSQSTAIVTGRILEFVKNYRLTEALRKYNDEGRDNYYSPLYEYMRK